jgi:LysM repeat protein
MSATFSVVVPRSHAGPRQDAHVPNYVRRRAVVVGLLVFALALTLFGAGQVLASRGGDPASTSAVRPATPYIVQPGDTLWSLADTFHGPWTRAAYLDRLIDGNGGSGIQVGQLLELP